MAKKNEVVVACVDGEKLADAVNHGCAAVGLSKLLDAKVDAIKGDILNRMPTEATGNASVRLTAQNGSVLIAKAESYELDMTIPQVKELADAGKLPFVSKKVKATIPQENIAEMKKVLGEVLFAKLVAVSEDYDVDPSGYREFEGSNSEHRAVVVPNVSVKSHHKFTFAPSVTTVQDGEKVVAKISKSGLRILELA